MEFLRRLFDTTDFTPRWYVGDWSSGLGWLIILSDLAIWAAYTAIPFVLAYFVLRRRDLPFRGVFVLFVAFILACGATYVVDAAMFWWPVYRFGATVKLFTAVVSWATVFALIPIIPNVLKMRSPEELEREIDSRQRAETALSEANRRLQDQLMALRESEERFRLLVDGASDHAIYLLDPQGNVTSWNQGGERVTGFKSDEVLGRHFALFYPPEEAAAGTPQQHLEAAARDGRYEEEAERVRQDGSRFWANVVITALRDAEGRLQGFSKVTRDVTTKKQAELSAHRLVAEETARKAAEESDRRKDEFLATLAHELRNPLAPIQNSLEVLKSPALDATSGKRMKEIMGRQVHQLVRLVDDLLDVSRVMRGKIDLRLERIDLASAVARAVETAQPLIDVHQHRLDVAPPTETIEVYADQIRLAQALANLLTNAAKYTPRGGCIRVSSRAEQAAAVVEVADDGVGIAPEALPRIFELFVQAKHTGVETQGGLGIGLTLVKNLVELHGGSVEARSDGPGMGSTFEIRLPLADSVEYMAPLADGSAPIAPLEAKVGSILVVDDNKDAADSLAAMLRLRGHEVVVAYSGEQALELIPRVQPKLAFLDLGMPVMDGLELARRLRTDYKQELVLVALTGWGQVEDRKRTEDAGFDAHLVKPAGLEQLAALLARFQPATETA